MIIKPPDNWKELFLLAQERAKKEAALIYANLTSILIAELTQKYYRELAFP